jgi:L-alanine-DL-glutamate epimerase-like enolase superfamily enzyme
MQITKTEVVPTQLNLAQPVRMAGIPEIHSITAIFVRLETRDGNCAWGCAVAHPT